MKGPLKVYNPITSKIGIKYGPFPFSKNNIGAKNKDPRIYCMFSRINFVCMPHKGWMKNDSLLTQKWMNL